MQEICYWVRSLEQSLVSQLVIHSTCCFSYTCLKQSYAANLLMQFVAGWAHLKLVQIANEGNPAAHPNSDQREAKSGVGAAIERLEENLNK